MGERMKEKPTKLEGSVMMTKKGEKSQTCLINVFNFILLAEPPGSIAGKGLLEEAGGVREGARLGATLSAPSSHSILWPQHLCSLPGGCSPCRQLLPRAHSTAEVPILPIPSLPGAASLWCVTLGHFRSWLVLGACDVGAGREDTSTT